MILQFAIALILPLVFILCPIAASVDPAIAKPGCNSTCGNVNISYPFGMENSNCYAGEWFQIECVNNTTPFLKYFNISVKKTDVNMGTVVINNPIYRSNCTANNRSKSQENDYWRVIDLGNTTFVYSQYNRFVSQSCNTTARLHSDDSVVGRCDSYCDQSYTPTVDLKNCRGRYCCDTSIPTDLSQYNVSLQNINPKLKRPSRDYKNECSFGVIASTDWIYNNGQIDKNTKYVPAVLDWELPIAFDQTYNISTVFESHRVCYQKNSLTNYNNSVVYKCRCIAGFHGNPYLSNGCNTTDQSPGPGPDPTKPAILVGVFSTIGSILFLIGVSWSYKILKRRRKQKRKEKYFKQNGGQLLKQKLSSGETNFDQTKLFNSKDLEKATDRFNVNRVLGKGGQGTVYKGMLVDGQIVAVKKYKVNGNIEEFINEVVILSQLNHRNVVKLLGFCLETQVPLLVYEFIPNGNLYEYLQEQNEELPMTWEMRLRIAIEVAGALFYLLSAAAQPIYHRDIKSTNILLDGEYRAKVADFGTSRMVFIEDTHLTTAVQGNFGYLDYHTEYYHTSQITEKSDVYSFGVVLVELLTGKKPIPVEGKSLASYFIMCMEEDRLFEILDKRIMKGEGEKEGMMAVAKLAIGCLELTGKKRPTMREVTMELEGIQKLGKRLDHIQEIHEEVKFDAIDEVYQSWDASNGSILNSNASASSSSVVLPSLSIG